MGTKDNRRYPRLNAEFWVQLDLGGAVYRERAFSLGGGGLFIRNTQNLPLQMGTEIAVQFRPAKHLPLINAKAKVCYLVEGRGAAIEFTEINPDDQRRLLGFIQHKRAAVRVHAHAPLATQIKSEDSMSLAFSREISAGGMFIETTDLLPIGTHLTLRFNLSESDEIMVLLGEVSYHAGNLGMGVRFVDATPEDLQRIDEYVAAESASSAKKPVATKPRK